MGPAFQEAKHLEELSKRKRNTKSSGTLEFSTPLHQACKNGDTELVTRLLDSGAALNKPDRAGYTPFMDAINNGTCIQLRYLIL